MGWAWGRSRSGRDLVEMDHTVLDPGLSSRGEAVTATRDARSLRDHREPQREMTLDVRALCLEARGMELHRVTVHSWGPSIAQGLVSTFSCRDSVQFSEVKMVQYTIRGICGSIGAVLDPFRFVVSSSAAPFTFILLLGSSPGRRVRGVPLGLGPGRALTSRCARDHASHGADRAPRRRARAPRSAHRGRHVDKNIKFEISQILASRPSFSGPAGRYPF